MIVSHNLRRKKTKNENKLDRVHNGPRKKKKDPPDCRHGFSFDTHLVVALDGIDEGLVGYNLRFSVEESLKTLFDCLQLLLTDLIQT